MRRKQTRRIWLAPYLEKEDNFGWLKDVYECTCRDPKCLDCAYQALWKTMAKEARKKARRAVKQMRRELQAASANPRVPNVEIDKREASEEYNETNKRMG